MDRMIHMAVGTDIVEVKRIKKALEKGTKFRDRVYTPEEWAYGESRKRGQYQSLAGIYAAKEAFVKALGTGLRKGSWLDMEISHDALGAPIMTVRGPFHDMMVAKGYSKVILSISHCKEYALCQVILL